MGKLGLRVTSQVCGTFADAAKLLDLRKSCRVVTTKAVMTLCVADDEWYIGVEHDRIDLLVVPEIPSKALLLQS